MTGYKRSEETAIEIEELRQKERAQRVRESMVAGGVHIEKIEMDEGMFRSDSIMTEYKGIRIELPQSLQDMMFCHPESVKMFNIRFWSFAEHVIDETRKNYRVSEEDEQDD